MEKIPVLALVVLGVICAQAVRIPATLTESEQKLLESSESPLSKRPSRRCYKEGISPIPGDCTGYIICIRGFEYRRKCPENFFFDSVMFCTPDDTADCGVTPLKQTQARKWCPRSYGIFPYTKDCHKYVVCHEGRARVRTCPEGTVYHRYVGCVEGNACPESDRSEIEKPEDSDERKCRLPADTGKCQAHMIRWYFDHTKGECRTFVYGGCEGNENNFHTRQECEQSCLMREQETSAESECDLPALPGPCNGYFPRYYYDSKSGICKWFIYGGCKGNGNNFETLEECTDRCAPKIETSEESECDLPALPGPCNGYFPRYYYDSKSGICKRFIYGGCKGNGNNFETLEECTDRCTPKIEDLKDEDINSESSSQSKCKEGEFYHNPDMDCSRFVHCFNGEALSMNCAEGLHFSSQHQRCLPPCKAQCNRDIPCFMDERLCDKGKCFQCPIENGEFSDLYDCSIYHECKNGSSVIHACPNGKLFNHRTSRCSRKEKALCVYECEKLNSTNTHPLDMNSFIQCEQGFSTVKKCPDRKVFTKESGQCEDMRSEENRYNDVFPPNYNDMFHTNLNV